jgi:hypothetical protein
MDEQTKDFLKKNRFRKIEDKKCYNCDFYTENSGEAPYCGTYYDLPLFSPMDTVCDLWTLNPNETI